MSGRISRERAFLVELFTDLEEWVMVKIRGAMSASYIVVVVVFTLKAVPVSTQYFLASVLVQLTRTPSVVTG